MSQTQEDEQNFRRYVAGLSANGVKELLRHSLDLGTVSRGDLAAALEEVLNTPDEEF